uniref:uncharacterized protein LOC122586805 isoform X2 n=1 Tax=Erigeron canadensis TaxID=72917 RepID=UPI001CB96938|nr:uncharacterized protein LOC122586805 isoform X2 [Erigeron canadensis]
MYESGNEECLNQEDQGLTTQGLELLDTTLKELWDGSQLGYDTAQQESQVNQGLIALTQIIRGVELGTEKAYYLLDSKFKKYWGTKAQEVKKGLVDQVSESQFVYEENGANGPTNEV